MLRNLFDEIPLASGASFKNRLFMSPMTTQSAFMMERSHSKSLIITRFALGMRRQLLLKAALWKTKDADFPAH